MKYDCQMRRQWFDQYLLRVGGIPMPTVGPRVTCPCCGYPTIPERSRWEICCLCNWEDDGQDDPEADKVWGGPNQEYSLSDARLNFERHLIMYEPSIGGNENTPVQARAKIAMIATFDEMMAQLDSSNLDRYWSEILRLDKVLEEETARIVREWEQHAKRKRSR